MRQNRLVKNKTFLKWLFLTLLISALFFPGKLKAEPFSFGLRSAPPDLTVYLDGVKQTPVSAAAGVRNFNINGSGILRFNSPGYISIEYSSAELPLRNGLLEIRLERDSEVLQRLGVYATGIQPKSAFFTPDGGRVIVPLLGQRGIDVFRMEQEADTSSLVFERRLFVPRSTAAGFVEALIDERRREIWVSNMEENRVHIFDLDSLDFKRSLGTGGVFPKVIAQSPDGSITTVSNWISRDISVFNSETKELLRRIPVGGIPRGMAFSSDGNLLYVAIFDEPLVAVVDMRLNRVSSRFRFHEGTGAARHILYRNGRLYVSDMYRGTVNILNASTGALLASRRLGPNVNTIALSPDGRHIFASSRGRNNPAAYTLPGPYFGAVFMLMADNLSQVERVWGRSQPTGLAVSPNGRYLVFTNFLDANMELYLIKE